MIRCPSGDAIANSRTPHGLSAISVYLDALCLQVPIVALGIINLQIGKVAMISQFARCQRIPTVAEHDRAINFFNKDPAGGLCNDLKPQIEEKPVTGQRNRALILVGFGGWFRRSEMLSFIRDQLVVETGRIVVSLHRSKTNQTGQKVERIELTEIAGEYADICPYSAMRQWLDASGITDGPVFRKIYKGKLTESGLADGSWFWRLLTDLGQKAGIPFHIAPHRTLRTSPITLAVLSGQPMPTVMKRARHMSADTTTRYFDEAAAGQATVNRAVYGNK